MFNKKAEPQESKAAEAAVAQPMKYSAPKSGSSLGDYAVIGAAILLIASVTFQLLTLKGLFLF